MGRNKVGLLEIRWGGPGEGWVGLDYVGWVKIRRGGSGEGWVGWE